jgi:hypothetical protein
MKTGRSLSEVLVELQRQQEVKRDYISPSASLMLQSDGRTLTMGENSFSTTDLFHRQVGSALSIPAKYYDLMQAQKPALLAENVNAWFSDRDTSYMLRTMDGTARALLSDRYRRIDNMEVASTVLPLFAGVAGMQVMSCEVTENRLFLKVVDTRREAVCVGDAVQFGVVVSNSEVGLGAVSVQPLVYTLRCTNGLIVNSLGERKTHVGRAAKGMDDFAVYTDETLEAEDRAFLLKLRDVVNSTFDEVKQQMIIGRLEEAAGAKLTGRVQDVVELTGRDFGLSSLEQDGVLRYLIEGGDLSLYGLSNAVTRYSQDVESYDRATALEGIGWNVATMEPRKWKEINAT